MEKIQIFLQKWRVRLGHLFGIVLLIFSRPEMRWLIAGTAVALAGEAIRIVSAGCIQKDTDLSVSGPYAFTRNPLYLGSFLMYLGFCIAASNGVVLAVFPPFFFIVYYATIFREEAYLSGAFGEKYAKYCSEVPRFFPGIRSSRAEGGALRFSLARAMGNREYEAMIAVVVILGLLWAMGLTGFRVIH